MNWGAEVERRLVRLLEMKRVEIARYSPFIGPGYVQIAGYG